MNITKHDTETDANGVPAEVIEQESEDGKLIMGFRMTPADIKKVMSLTDFCRLRYSEIKGFPCTNPVPPGPDKCSDPITASMTGVEFQLVCEKEDIERALWGLINIPEQYNIKNFKETFLVLEETLLIFHDRKLSDDVIADKLLNAIKVGNDYLKLSGIKSNRELCHDWLIRQPII